MNERETIEAMTRMLDAMLNTRDPFAITNDSMRVLVTELGRRMAASASRDRTGARIRTWNEALPQFQRQLLTLATRDQVRFSNGRILPIMSESKVAELMALCPDKPEF